jgi:hypothetical protein
MARSFPGEGLDACSTAASHTPRCDRHVGLEVSERSISPPALVGLLEESFLVELPTLGTPVPARALVPEPHDLDVAVSLTAGATLDVDLCHGEPLQTPDPSETVQRLLAIHAGLLSFVGKKASWKPRSFSYTKDFLPSVTPTSGPTGNREER